MKRELVASGPNCRLEARSVRSEFYSRGRGVKTQLIIILTFFARHISPGKRSFELGFLRFFSG